MRVSIVGVGDITKLERFAGMNSEDVQRLIKNVSKLLVEKDAEVVIIPDRGIPVEIAKTYKELGGKKILGVVPVNDIKYGIKHIEENLDMLDEKIEVNSWYDADGEIAAAGDYCICVGMSAGVMRDISVLKYHYKYLESETKLIVFENTMSGKIAPEIEEAFRDKLFYINSFDELKTLLK
ncbi:hypothetical protein GF361_02785 [Candidatus Woesearchaeota archaeon]|nr:hypothetical protein [Candidatus Woesearchaeota archaeon]